MSVCYSPGDRAKVTNPSRKGYGRVGTVLYAMGGQVRLEFANGKREFYYWDDLRDVTKRGKRERRSV